MTYYIDTSFEDTTGFDSGFPVFNDYLNNRNDSAVVHYIVESESEN